MEPDNKLNPQSLANGSDEDGTILSEDALRKLSKSLTKTIPKDGHKFDGTELR